MLRSWMGTLRIAAAIAVALTLTTPAPAQAKKVTPAKRAVASKLTSADAQAFLERAEKRLRDLSIKAARAQWVAATYIIDDTEAIAADYNEKVIGATTELALEARKFDGVKLPADTQRRLMLLKLSLPMPAPNNDKEREELTRIATSLEGDYGKGKFCIDEAKKDCYDLTKAEDVLRTNRDPELLKKIWTGWHTISPKMKDRYARFVELSNKGAREMGFKDTGALWRSNYDMPPDEFAKEIERLWEQVKPLYQQLHTYTRTQLRNKYGDAVPESGMIPAHLLGNMWAQDWSNIYEFVAPPNQALGYDLTELLVKNQYDPLKMVRTGEAFFTSLGFEPLPKTFWEKSQFVKPQDRDVVCHASAWSMDFENDLRLKMCIKINAEDFNTIHHELGHNVYQRAYNKQPLLYQSGANDGFHEAVGDVIALSITPEYLKQINLLAEVPQNSGDLGLLMERALDKVAFLPFGLLIDQWRWKVFNGEITPAQYNQAWWDMKNKYQGVVAPAPRPTDAFDPGAKYHVPGNTPYTRYFLAAIYQFQFHRALCREAGYTGPLHRCSIYGNKKAGEKLKAMLELGQSRPWPEALAAVTGEKQADATAILEYFAPLMKWLEEQNRGQKVGWEMGTTAVAGK